jgi:hypothetical protein
LHRVFTLNTLALCGVFFVSTISLFISFRGNALKTAQHGPHFF